MVGSVIDGEDVLQDALIKAVQAFATAGPIGNPEGWLFRIAHNTALDFLRKRSRQEALYSAEEVDMMADQLDAVTSRQIAAASLRTFMRLNVTQRSSVILMDVLGCSLAGNLRGDGCKPCRRPRPRWFAAARSCEKLPMSPTMRRSRNCPTPIVSGSAPMSPISTRGISTPSAT